MNTPTNAPMSATPEQPRRKPKHWSFFALLWLGVLIGSIAVGVAIVALLATIVTHGAPPRPH